MYEKLLSEFKIRGLTVKNRIMMPALNLSYADAEGHVTPRLLEFYRRRAEGGAGLIVVGAVGVDPGRINTAGVLELCRDEFIPGMAELTKAVHAHGAAIFPQLWHPGAYARSAEFSGQQPVAPSPVASGFTREMPRELTEDEIEELIGFFAAGARRAAQAGFDGVELCGSAGYLISQFLSPKTNHRVDRFGGDTVERRGEFLRRVIAAVKAAAGEDFPLMVRLAGNEFVPGGGGREQTLELAPLAQSWGADALSITGGWHETGVPQLSGEVPRAGFSYLAQGVRRAVSVPVAACNRMDPASAEDALARGHADFIGFGRALIADPDMPSRAASGRAVRPCVACNQGCMDNIFKGRPLSCLANPQAGQEYIAPAPPEKTLNILVVGGGPAGMQAALTAAERGHRVTLREKSAALGGQLRLAAAPASRRDFSALADYYEAALREAGVTVELLSPVDGAGSAAEGYDRVVVATGAAPKAAPFPVEPGARVAQAWDVLAGKAEPGDNVVIVGSAALAVETACFLTQRGAISPETAAFLLESRAESPETVIRLLQSPCRRVTILKRHDKIGAGLGASTRWSILAGLKRRGVTELLIDRVVSASPDGLLVERDGQRELLPCTCAVLALGSEPCRPKLPEGGRAVFIGDALEPKKAIDAIRAAYEAAAIDFLA